jgi:heptosyltransferase-2
MIASTVVRSLYTGITTESSGLGGTGVARADDIDAGQKGTTTVRRCEAKVIDRLLVLAPNWLGDAVMALPAIANVCSALPAASLAVAARPTIAPLFTMVPGVAEIVTLAGRSASVRALAERRSDVALILPNSFNAARLARAAGIRERWGYRTDFRSLLLTRAVPAPSRAHQTEYYRRLVEALGFPGGPRAPRLEVSEERRAAGAALLGAAGWDRRQPLVGIAPGAAFGGAKRWPAHSFAALADGLAGDGARVVVVGAAADRSAAAELRSAMRTPADVIDLIGRTDVPMLAAVLSQCRALVTNDSGAMHVAAAVGINVTALIGPTRERETGPMGTGRHAVLTHDVWCRPCMLRECPLTHRCMTGITVDAALSATRHLL